MLQTAASLVVDDGTHAEALGQAEYSNGNSQRKRPGTRKRKRRPQITSVDASVAPTAAESHSKYWRGQVEDDRDAINPNKASAQTDEEIRPSLQSSFKRRKQPAIREPLAALEKEQKLYELRNKPETSDKASQGTHVNNRNSANLKNILKNNGGLSLSEILQQKNLSLDDLLKGKENALQALQTTASAPVQKTQGLKYPSKPKFKLNTPTVKLTEDSGEQLENSKERNKFTALHRLKLFGSSSRPSGIQVGLADHLTTRKKEAGLYTPITTTTTTTTTLAPPTTRIPLYKKILHQRPTLKSTLLLKNMAVMASVEPDRIVTSWDSKENEEETQQDAMAIEDEEEQAEDREDHIQNSLEITTQLPPELVETTTTKVETTTSTTEKPSPKEIKTTTRRMFTTTRGFGRTTNRFTTTTTTPTATTTSSTSTTTTTALPLTTTTTAPTTTTASSSTMNLTPKANLNLNTEDIRERLQETLLQNLIEKEDSFETDAEDDLENFFEETPRPRTTKYLETSTITTRMKLFSTTVKPTESPNVIPDFDNVDDRTDLLELIEDRRSGNRLFKVLEQRNMTLEELIEHRKRGSSQLHLATIVETPSRFYPDKKVVLQDNMDIVTAFENFPHFNLLNLKSVKPDDIKTDSQGSSYFTSIIDIEPTDEIYKTNKGLPASSSLSADVDKASLLPDRSVKALGFFPSWKTLALASLATTSTSNNNNKDVASQQNPFYLEQPKMLLENNSANEDEFDSKENELALMNSDSTDEEDNDYQAEHPIQAAVRLPDNTAEAIENEVARAHDLVDLELSGHGFQRSPQAAGALVHSHKHGSFYTNMPAGIKSAIVASATIVLTALVTFMIIFAVCRWKQKRHRMTNIMKSYNAMKSKLPTIATTTAAATATPANPNLRRSSFKDMNDLLGGSGLSVAATITTTSASAGGMPTTPPLLNASQTTTMLAGNHNHNSSCGQHNKYQLQRQSSLLFQRSMNPANNNEKPTNLAILSGCNLLDIKRNSNTNNNNMRGSTTSLSFSLTSGHNISNSHINTVDATSPEVQEYLFDTLRNSF